MTEEETTPPATESEEETTPADAGKETAATGESASEEARETAAPKEGMSEAELRAQIEEHFHAQPVGEVLMQFLISLSTLAYVKMGITEDTIQYRDLEQAGLAIDSFKALLDAAGPRLDSQDASALAGALASMQMTFAKASEEPGGGKKDDGKKKGDPADRLWVPGKE